MAQMTSSVYYTQPVCVAPRRAGPARLATVTRCLKPYMAPAQAITGGRTTFKGSVRGLTSPRPLIKRSQPVKVEAAAAAASPSEDAAPSKDFLRTRLFVFVTMFCGYGATYLTRNSLNAVAPFMLADSSLGLDMKAIGGLTSILPIAYGLSKGLSGVLGARTSPRILLAAGLTATAIANLGFGVSNAYWLFLTFWFANGLLQGLGAPACARILTTWFSDKERGTYWGFWTASNNIGGFLAPVLAATAAKHYGWRWGLFAPGIAALVVAAAVLTFMKDAPEDAGFPPVEAPEKVVAGAVAEKKPSLIESFMKECVQNPYVWLFAITYFFVYVVRQGVTSWFIFYLMKAKGVADGAAAAVRVSGLELGGLCGSLSAGALSDYLVRKNAGGKAGNVGLRVRVVMTYAFGTALALAAFWAAPEVAWIQTLLVAVVGFFLYGPQMLIGLCGAEAVSPAAVSACQGFLGWIAYLGAANAGVPLAAIVQAHGWNAYFLALIVACGVQLVLLAPMLNLKSHKQRVAEEEAKTA